MTSPALLLSGVHGWGPQPAVYPAGSPSSFSAAAINSAAPQQATLFIGAAPLGPSQWDPLSKHTARPAPGPQHLWQQSRARHVETGHRQQHLLNILDLPPHATAADIKKAYLQKAKQFHPDRNQGCSEAAQKFRSVKDAYDHLSRPVKVGQSAARQAASQRAQYPQGAYHYSYRQHYSTTYSNYGFDQQSSLDQFLHWVRVVTLLAVLLSAYQYNEQRKRFQHYLLMQRMKSSKKQARKYAIQGAGSEAAAKVPPTS